MRSTEVQSRPGPAEHPVAQPGTAFLASRWVRRGGIALFMFFFLKGMVWLGVFAAAGFGLTKL